MNEWLIEPQKNLLYRDDAAITIEPRAMDVLEFLMLRAGEVVTAAEILAEVWSGRPLHPAAVKKRINQIRTALDDRAADPAYILTVPKRGYCLIARVEPIKVCDAQASTIQRRDLTPNHDTGCSTLAVLPLQTLPDRSSQEYIAEGLTEEITTTLAKLPQLRVLPRSSVMRYASSRPSVARVRKELKVDHVLEGSIQHEGSSFRVVLHLIDARSERLQWSKVFDCEASAILALRRELSTELASQFELVLESDDLLATTKADSGIDEAAVYAYVRGLASTGAMENFSQWYDETRAHFEQAVALDDRFADAWAQLALIETMQAVWFDRDAFTRARECAEKALSFDDGLAMAHTALGYAHLLHDWNLTQAGASFERAVTLSPNDPATLHGYMTYLRVQGDVQRALEISKKLLANSPVTVARCAERVKVLYDARHYEEVIKEAELIRDIYPAFHCGEEAVALARLGRYEESHLATLAAYEYAGAGYDHARTAATEAWRTGGYEASLRALLKQELPGELVQRKHWLFAEVGDLDQAIHELDRLIKARAPWLIGVRSHPDFDMARLDPRFCDMVAPLNLPPLEQSAARQADIARLLAFKGDTDTATSLIAKSMAECPDDPRLPRWIETRAWAEFAAENYSEVLNLVDRMLEHGLEQHAAAFAYLLRAASLVQQNELAAARSACEHARRCWPSKLDIDRDLAPLFLGGDPELRARFLTALREAEL